MAPILDASYSCEVRSLQTENIGVRMNNLKHDDLVGADFRANEAANGAIISPSQLTYTMACRGFYLFEPFQGATTQLVQLCAIPTLKKSTYRPSLPRLMCEWFATLNLSWLLRLQRPPYPTRLYGVAECRGIPSYA